MLERFSDRSLFFIAKMKEAGIVKHTQPHNKSPKQGCKREAKFHNTHSNLTVYTPPETRTQVHSFRHSCCAHTHTTRTQTATPARRRSGRYCKPRRSLSLNGVSDGSHRETQIWWRSSSGAPICQPECACER